MAGTPSQNQQPWFRFRTIAVIALVLVSTIALVRAADRFTLMFWLMLSVGALVGYLTLPPQS